RGHDRLPAYGTGATQPKPYWQAFIRQAVAGNYLTINIQKYGALQLARRGRAVAAGEAEFAMRKIEPGLAAKAAKPAKARKLTKPVVAQGDQDLLAALKTLRLDLARSRNVPAYVVFHDTVLIEMAQARPANLEQLATINGVGPRKLEDFGETFLEAIASA
ncbi:MAG: HRDC domain-containing protein, partial [Alphaproteobacteria bacterium]